MPATAGNLQWAPMTRSTKEQLAAGISHVFESPLDNGRLEKIFVRPRKRERLECDQAVLSPREGILGDNWLSENWLFLADGSPDPRNQVSLMNLRVLQLVAGDGDSLSLAGDNLIVDMDLGRTNLPVGQILAVGGALLEVTGVPHLGCKSFAERYGKEAVSFVNSREGKRHRLRGVYARIVQGGSVAIGDIVRKAM